MFVKPRVNTGIEKSYMETAIENLLGKPANRGRHFSKIGPDERRGSPRDL
jgi:hypothetical protein